MGGLLVCCSCGGTEKSIGGSIWHHEIDVHLFQLPQWSNRYPDFSPTLVKRFWAFAPSAGQILAPRCESRPSLCLLERFAWTACPTWVERTSLQILLAATRTRWAPTVLYVPRGIRVKQRFGTTYSTVSAVFDCT